MADYLKVIAETGYKGRGYVLTDDARIYQMINLQATINPFKYNESHRFKLIKDPPKDLEEKLMECLHK